MSPNLFEPDENITDEDINTVEISVVVILPLTLRFEVIVREPVILELPLTDNPPLIDVGTFTTNPLFGDIFAVAEPDFN